MLELKAYQREKFGRKTELLRQQGLLPAVLYGEELKNIGLEVKRKEFEKVFSQAGYSSLISLEMAGQKYNVLIYDSQKDPLSGQFSHVDFFHPSARKQTTAEVSLVFVGEAPAEKQLGGNLVKEIQSLEVKGLAQNLPKEIEINLGSLKTFDDKILVGALSLPQGITTIRNKEDIVALVIPSKKEEEPAGQPTEKEKAKKAV